MNADLVLGLIIGLVAGLVLATLVGFLRHRRLARRHRRELAEREATVLGLRQELAQDRETNRRLRYELAVQTPEHLTEVASVAEAERDLALAERDRLLGELEQAQDGLAAAETRSAEQDHRLRRYREALQEIRLSLEEQGRSRGLSMPMLDTADLGRDEIEEADQEPASVDLRSAD